MISFSEIIKKCREERKLLLREVAALTQIDQSIICKFESGERKPTKEQVCKLAKIYELDIEELLISWQSDKIAYDLLNEKNFAKILTIAEKKIEYFKNKKS